MNPGDEQSKWMSPPWMRTNGTTKQSPKRETTVPYGKGSRMPHTITVIPIDHRPVTHEIDMQADPPPQPITLLELIAAVSEASNTEREAISTITHMLESGRLRLLTDFSPELGEPLPAIDETGCLSTFLNLAS